MKTIDITPKPKHGKKKAALWLLLLPFALLFAWIAIFFSWLHLIAMEAVRLRK